MKNCVVCGVSFDPNGTRAICCSVECSKERRKENIYKWRERNAEYNKKAKSDWREQNLKRCKENFNKWREQNRERHNEKSNDWKKRNPEHVKEIQRKWRERNPEKATEKNVRGYLRNQNGINNPPESLVQLLTEIRLTKQLVKELTK